MPKRDASTATDALAQRLLKSLSSRILAARHPFLLGLSGLQGSGKSTLAAALVRQARGRGWPAQTLSLDDVYLGRRARRERAARVHSLLRTRGVPGTHDLDLLRTTLDALAEASANRPVALPRFDKGRDTRRPPSRWPRVRVPPRLIVLEGWCIGVPAQSDAALRTSMNALERDEDADGRWRRYANDSLEAMQDLWQRLDALVLLQAPDWPTVCRWRAQAEAPLRARGAPQAMNTTALRRFMQHYERLSRHALRTLPPRADIVIALDAARRVISFREKAVSRRRR
ncbi:kinase [Oleiagrimonas sp. MCCC 1A03011]|uniref:kinase n=1 Tax=Oleiagrimonas sp. MCCC 1A03011 TaxID=1926883 RepID=UPI000DC3D020|nr:kinase [Oleiagrimonas sp. MCCC 1A03011]RAP58654.1 kinase [Oleiagrimonas sp. MCCC 1A03011]